MTGDEEQQDPGDDRPEESDEIEPATDDNNESDQVEPGTDDDGESDDVEPGTDDDGGDSAGERDCVNCGEPVPDDASVCPSCGTLQPPRRSMETPAVAARTIRSMGPIRPTAPVTGPVPMAQPITTAAPRPPGRRRSRWGPIVATVVVLALIAGGVAAAVAIDRNRDDDKDQASSSSDPRVAAIEEFCDDPRPLTTPKDIAAWEPGGGAVAYIEVPQPTSSTKEPKPVVAQIAPKVGTPNLDLEKAVPLVSLAVCVDQTGSTKTDKVCKYELTGADDAGTKDEAPLLQTRYRISLIELKTGKTLAKDTLKTSPVTCPTDAYLGGKGVSAELGQDTVLAWVGFNFVNGEPVN